MNLPPSNPNSFASNNNQGSGVRFVRGQPSAWGLPAPGSSSRRGLTPLSTNLASSSSETGRIRNTASPAPFTSTFSSVLNNTISNENTRGGHSSSLSNSPFPSLQTGSQQAHAGQSLLSPRSRAITPSSASHSAFSAAASTTASQSGGGGSSGGGGGFTRNQTFSPPLPQHNLSSPTNNTFERSSFPGSNSATSSQSSVSKIVATQINILLGSITEKEGKAKWESQAEAIHKLVETNGMENFPKYFRRLVIGNSPQIFPNTSRNVENPGNYPMLVQEIEKIKEDPEQASRIADAIDTSESDVFRDFDLSTFMKHFNLDGLATTLLASAMTRVTRQDLKKKAEQILIKNQHELYIQLSNSNNIEQDVKPSLLAACALKLIEDTPKVSDADSEFMVNKVKYCINLRYSKQGLSQPPEIKITMFLINLLGSEQGVTRDIRICGPQSTASLEALKAILARHSEDDVNEMVVSDALLLMVLSPNWRQYDPSLFVSAIHEYFERPLDWSKVIQGFDREALEISKDRFLVLYKALVQVAKEDSQFDIQGLWGGSWRFWETQLSFLRAFVSCSPSELDATTIPGLRQAYDPNDSLDGPEDAMKEVQQAQQDTMISLDAVSAIINILVPAEGQPPTGSVVYLTELIGDKVPYFLCSSAGIEKPWTSGQENLMRGLLRTFLDKNRSDYTYVLHTLWKREKQWVALNLIEAHLEDPLELTKILELAQELGWLEDLLTLVNGFGIDLAALAHRKGLLDIGQWAADKDLQDTNGVIHGLSKFLVLKAQDELRISRDEQPQPRTVTLSMKTAYDMLAILDEHLSDRTELKALQRQCFQAYPRLILLCEGIEDNIDVDCKKSNAMPRTADAEMQELYKRMYSTELAVSQILDYLHECKTSNDPARVDLFACMIHGLFDEFSCFSEYPLPPLATTAVLFGGIMQVGLISDLTLRVGQEMVLDSVRDYPPEASMYKFGLQALITVLEKLRSVDWTDYCKQLVRIPGLRGTQAYDTAVEALSENGIQSSPDEANGIHSAGDGLTLTNGDMDGFLSQDSNVEFESVKALPSPTDNEPNEDVKDKVVFFFNNVSSQNLASKFDQLQNALQNGHYEWFANFLVEGRAKVEPNYQALYLEMLQLLGSKHLWSEVLRETYLGVKKLLDSEAIMQSAPERKNLKNLSVWLGSLTIARNQPIKHHNISFLELLMEGIDYGKLLLVIPFTCNVLAQGARSVLFKPPNPWVLEIIAALLELYHHFDIKLNQKFEIEVLCKEFGLSIDSIAPSTYLRERPVPEEEIPNVMYSDGADGFDDLSLGSIHRSVRNPKFELESFTSTLPDLENMLVFPPPNGSPATQARLRQIVTEAVRRAITEIIAPVVERSVTIATIATSALIHKDFASEPDEDRVRQAAQQMVGQLSGSLALVTCKEPLKMSMTNFIRAGQAELPENTIAEGSILMCVNDNLDIACNIVEEHAVKRSLPEIESHIETEISQRRQHKAERPNEPFVGPAFNHHSGRIPPPYNLNSSGLNAEQFAIYTEFARQSRGATNHGQTLSADSGRQLPDVLSDAFSSMPNVHTPANSAAMPHQAPGNQQHQQSDRMLPPPLPSTIAQAHTNGYVDISMIEDRVLDIMGEIRRIIHENPNLSLEEIQSEGSVIELLNQAWELISSSPEPVPINCAEHICKALYGESMNRSEIEVFVYLLSRICQTDPIIQRAVAQWAESQNDESILSADVTISLLKQRILQFKKVDASLTRLIYDRDRNEDAIEALSDIVDALLLTTHTSALRADLASSLSALGQWCSDNPGESGAQELIQRLKSSGVRDTSNESSSESNLVQTHQTRYVFSEWIRLCEKCLIVPSENLSTAFISHLQTRHVFGSQEHIATFLRLSIDDAMETYDIFQERISTDQSKEYTSKALFKVDCLARLIIQVVKSQGQITGSVKANKAAYMDSILSLITLIMNNHQVVRGERFNQRIFLRLLSTILCDWHDLARETPAQDHEMLLVFADNFLMMEPRYFPSFIHGWLMLISHRFFMPNLLKLSNDDGWESFARIISAALSYVCQFLKSETNLSLALDLYRAVLRIILILHHDFPEFLAEHHFTLCSAIPAHCTQLYNLILSAYPSSFPALPNPFEVGLKVDRLEDIRRAPRIAGDFVLRLVQANIKETIDLCLKGNSTLTEHIPRLAKAIRVARSDGATVDYTLLHAIALYIAQSATAAASQKSSLPFEVDSPQTALLTELARELQPDARYSLVCAMVNQLRYPNSHTQYFSYALLHLFGTDLTEQQESEVPQQIVRVLVERLHVVKPHPWGLLITILELMKNPEYNFFKLDFIKNAPAIQAVCQGLKNPRDEEHWPSGEYQDMISG